MSRYFCVYFVNTSNSDSIKKENKRTKVIKAETGSIVIGLLKEEHSATKIKYIRDLNHSKPYFRDDELHKLERDNNFKNSEYAN